MPFVLDASTTAAWCFPDVSSKTADQAFDRLAEDEAIAPGLWWVEIRNILIVAERRGRIDTADTARFLSDLSRLPIAIDHNAVEATVLDLARGHNLTVYDAMYLELASRHALPLATLDRKLVGACRSSGVPVIGDASG
jgi:predicted nucleic acid-binding protein